MIPPTSSRNAELRRDALTGLHGPDAVRHRLEEWGAAGIGVHALLLGLRRFDAINLAYGPAAGDAALVEVAARIVHFATEELDGPFLAVRSGGNFMLLASEPCSRERWQLFAEQLADAVARPIAAPTGLLRLSPRLALLRGQNAEAADLLLDRLGQALDAALRQPVRRIAWADGAAARVGRTAAQLEADLLRAIDRDEIEVLFQPQFRLGAALCDDSLSGAEALARWDHPRLGRIGAGALFAIAERADHVVPLSRQIARKALEGARDWPEHLRLSLNIAPADLAVGSSAGELARLLDETGFPAARLTLEVTEQALLGDIALAGRLLGELAEQGVRIALDDFGAGFCNFRYLKVLPLHYLKLDRSMVDGIAADARDLAVLRAILAMARALDLAVIAEGVEQEAQRNLLAAERCAFYQGFLRAPPMSGAAFLALGMAQTIRHPC